MNTSARINWQGRFGLLTNYGCGRLALENDALSFWQSRMTSDNNVPPIPALVDIPALASAARATPANADNN